MANARAKALKTSNPKEAQQATEWIQWLHGSHYANVLAMVHALGLHRDPSRGRTHIVFRMAKWTPKASKDIKHRFRITHAGVFKQEDVYGDIERMLKLKPGEGKKHVAMLQEDLDSANDAADAFSVFDLTFGDKLDLLLKSSTSGAPLRLTYFAHSLSCGPASFPIRMLRLWTYDPHWRKTVNLGEPPEPLVLSSGAKDVEQAF